MVGVLGKGKVPNGTTLYSIGCKSYEYVEYNDMI